MNITRRGILATVPATVLLSRVGWAEAAPVPLILQHEIWHHPATVKYGDLMRATIFDQISGKYIGAHRLATTQRVRFQARYTFEMVSDLAALLGEEIVATELAHIMAQEFSAELDAFRNGSRLNLVALDTTGPMIDINTFEPVLNFYFEHNV